MVSHEAGSSGIAMHDIDAQLFDRGGGMFLHIFLSVLYMVC